MGQLLFLAVVCTLLFVPGVLIAMYYERLNRQIRPVLIGLWWIEAAVVFATIVWNT